jgi:hypothetical protein
VHRLPALHRIRCTDTGRIFFFNLNHTGSTTAHTAAQRKTR